MPTFSGLPLRIWAWLGRKPASVCYVNGGIGDELLLTAIAAAGRKAGNPLHILTDRPEIWRGNHDPLSLQTGVELWFYVRRRGWVNTEIRHLAYNSGNGRHIAQQMADHLGVTLPRDWRPIMVMPQPPKHARRIVIQNSCRGARYPAVTKEWPLKRWHELAARLTGDFELVQVGTAQDPPIRGAQDLRGRTTLRESAHIIGGARCFVGLESGLMHVAAAVGTPAVIIYGGRTRPHETGYAFHRHLTRNPPCAGCGLNNGCPHQLACMDIPVEECESAIRDSLATRQASDRQ